MDKADIVAVQPFYQAGQTLFSGLSAVAIHNEGDMLRENH
ncbi:MAG: hypothetical protein DHS20C20_02500 [Ardenticatenaceae bacterium]|nr:MAG: hypothetical protein DHS20C20_02500 [Ardenticatenaceae bacterium]